MLLLASCLAGVLPVPTSTSPKNRPLQAQVTDYVFYSTVDAGVTAWPGRWMYNAVAGNASFQRGLRRFRTVSPVEASSYTGRRELMGEESHKTKQELWEKYMEVEHKELEQ